MNCDNKKIYVILTYTGTIASKIIKYFVNAEYSHVSISLDEDLNEMYSFARKYAYVFFLCGYIHESRYKNVFKRFKNTKASVYTLNVTVEQYNIIKKIIHDMYNNRKKYKFNIMGLFANGLNIRFKKRKYYFYCVEFVKYLFDKANIEIQLPELTRPDHFKNLRELELIYKGKLSDYKKS